MPRNNAKKHSNPVISNKADSNASNAGATISHFTQSDDEGNVIIELDLRPHNEKCIPEVEPELASSSSHVTATIVAADATATVLADAATVVADDATTTTTTATTVIDVPARHIDFESSQQSVFASMSSPELLPGSDADNNNAVAVVGVVAIVGDSSDSDSDRDTGKNTSVTSAAHNPLQNPDLQDVNVAPNPKPGFFRSVCRCFKNICTLMFFSCGGGGGGGCGGCCCRRKRKGSVQLPNEV